MDKFSYAFMPFQIGTETIIRPMLKVTLKKDAIEFPTALLVDSGADFSMLRSDIVEDYFLINTSDLKKGIDTSGIGGETEIAWINIKIEFGQRDLKYEEDIPFQVPLTPEKNPPLSLIGRNPFFYKYRVDFRMGYTDDLNLGKFVIYPETHKRDAERFKRPTKFKK